MWSCNSTGAHVFIQRSVTNKQQHVTLRMAPHGSVRHATAACLYLHTGTHCVLLGHNWRTCMTSQLHVHFVHSYKIQIMIVITVSVTAHRLCSSQVTKKQTATKGVAHWLAGWLTDCLTDWLTDLLAGWLVDWLFDCLIDWLADWLTCWLVDWLIAWLAGWLTD